MRPGAGLVYTWGPGILVNNDPFQSQKCPGLEGKVYSTLFTGHPIVTAAVMSGVSVHKTFLSEKPANSGQREMMGPTFLKL